MNNKQKGAIQLVVLAVLIFGVVSGIYLVQQRTNLLPKAMSPRNLWTAPSSSPSPINNDQDLKRVLMELESTNVELIDMDITGWSKPTATGGPGPQVTPVTASIPPNPTPGCMIPEGCSSPAPSASCQPAPACWNANPPCFMPMPPEGWCPSSSPSSSSSENSSLFDF